MDRTLKVFASTGHLFAEFTFYYDERNQATAHYTEYRRLYRDDEEDENKSVYPGMEFDLHLRLTQFPSIEAIKAHDEALVKKELGRDMKDPRGYTYVYEEEPIFQRYLAANHLETLGMIHITYSFINNTKEVKFLSAFHPRFDVEFSSNSLETNLDCILRIPVYVDRDTWEIHPNYLRRLPVWY